MSHNECTHVPNDYNLQRTKGSLLAGAFNIDDPKPSI